MRLVHRSSRVFLVLCAFLAPLALAERPLWVRYPAVAPDGSAIVFAYQGDLYRVPAEGGAARPLTLDDAYDYEPVWSRDGRTLAFASNRHGNFDVFTMPAEGGPATRLTFRSSDDVPSDFTPDGRAVLFESRRLDAAASSQFPSGVLPELYRVAVDGGTPPEQVLTLPAQRVRHDRAGRRLIFHDRKGYEDPWRKHHTSSVTRDIWTVDLDSGEWTRLTDDPAEDRNPVFAEDEDAFYYLSETSGTFNVVRRPLAGGAVEAITRFDRHPVRFLSRSDDGLLCFSHHGEIYTVRRGERPRRVEIELRADPAGRRTRNQTLSSGASGMAPSPNGKEVAFVARGEVFVTSLETQVTKRITDTPWQERSVDFDPKGRRLVYASERDGSWNLYTSRIVHEDEDVFFQATVVEEEPLLVSAADTFQPAFSPTGKEVAFLEDRTTLRVIDVETKKIRTVLPGKWNFSYADGDLSFRWAPDGKWLAVEFLNPGYWIPEVGLLAADGESEPINLTRSGYFEGSPRWALDGKLLTWFGDRDGLQGHAKAGPSETDVYGLFLTREAYDRFRLTKEELALLKEREEKEKKEKKKKAKKDDDEEKKKKEEEGEEEEDDDEPELPEVKLDRSGLEDRRVRLTLHSSRLSDAAVTPDGEKLLYLARFEKGYDLWVTELRTRETKILVKLGSSSGGSIEIAKDGKHALVLAGGSLSRVEIASGKRKPVPFRAVMTVDPVAERRAVYEHAWRQVAEKFYDPQLHGAPWDRLRRDYEPFLAHLNNDRDFAEMLAELLGELNASHTGARYRPPSAAGGDRTASLGLLYGARLKDGIEIAEVIEDNPLATGDSRLRAGLVLQAIDGTTLSPDVNLDRLLNHKAGEFVRLTLRDPEADETFEERVKPFSTGQESQLLYRRWVERNRRKTEELSGGRVGYVHVRSMSDSSYRTVQEVVLGRHTDKDALVIDTRFNGGGDLVDDLGIFLSGERYMDFISQEGHLVGMEPSRRWTRPSIVIAGEGNYSDAHCFPWAYQTLKIGKVLGMPVPGTCTFVWWEGQQLPGVVFGVPNMGIKGPDGRYLENLQLEPDIRVENPPADVAAGRDRQLERAVEEVLRELE